MCQPHRPKTNEAVYYIESQPFEKEEADETITLISIWLLCLAMPGRIDSNPAHRLWSRAMDYGSRGGRGDLWKSKSVPKSTYPALLGRLNEIASVSVLCYADDSIPRAHQALTVTISSMITPCACVWTRGNHQLAISEASTTSTHAQARPNSLVKQSDVELHNSWWQD